MGKMRGKERRALPIRLSPLFFAVILGLSGCPDAAVVLAAVSGHTVTYDSNGATPYGNVSVDDIRYRYGDTVTVTSWSPPRTGYVLAGWNTKANGSGTVYTPGQTFTMGYSDVTLYADWVPL